MKNFKYVLASMAAMVAMGVSMTSCDKDDDKDEKKDDVVALVPASQQVAGTYVGDITGSVMTSELAYENQSVVVTADSDNEVTITIPELTGGIMDMPAISVPGLKLKGSDGKYTIDVTDIEGKLPSGSAYKGVMGATITGNQIVVNWTVRPGAMPMDIVFKFEGDKQ